MDPSAALNFRDVGPLMTEAGLPLRSGVFFRSACPERTTAETFAAVLAENGIRTVVDLRIDQERAPLADSARPRGVRFLSVPFLDPIRSEWSNPQRADAVSTAERYLEMIEASGPATRTLFGLLAAGRDTPLLIHCAAGRDRTGMAYALILRCLGATIADVAEDYGKSHHAVNDGFGALEETILELFRLIGGAYGGLDPLLGRLGVTTETVAQVRSRYAP